jgi:uncharacterized protein YegL
MRPGPALNIMARHEATPCVLLLDLSDSMNDPVGRGKQTRIAALNAGLGTLQSALVTNSEALRRVEIAMVSVGGVMSPTEPRLVHDFLSVADFRPVEFQADGETPLGQGVLFALDIMERRLQRLNNQGRAVTRPWLFILSDGEPTDEETWPIAVKKARDAEQARRCLVVPFLIEGGDAPRLSDLMDGPVPTLLLADFPRFFKWVSRRVTRPVVGGVTAPTGAMRGVDAICEWQRSL